MEGGTKVLHSLRKFVVVGTKIKENQTLRIPVVLLLLLLLRSSSAKMTARFFGDFSMIERSDQKPCRLGILKPPLLIPYSGLAFLIRPPGGPPRPPGVQLRWPKAT